MRTTHVPMKIFRLQIQGKDIGQDRVHRRRNVLRGRRREISPGLQWSFASVQKLYCFQRIRFFIEWFVRFVWFRYTGRSLFGTFQCGIEERFSFFVFVLGKLDDKDGVFRGEAYEHYQADLSVDVVLHSAQPKGEECAEDRDRSAEQNAERQRPTLVERGENEEDE